MRKRNDIIRNRIAKSITTLILCAALLPFDVLAADLPETGEDISCPGTYEEGACYDDVDVTCGEDADPDVCGEPVNETDEFSEEELQGPAEPSEDLTFGEISEEAALQSVSEPQAAKEFRWGSYDLVFKNDVNTDSQLDDMSAPARTMITGHKKYMFVKWTAADDENSIDGYIILRRSGSEKVYKEIKKTTETSFKDKGAKVSNRTYRYTVVGYKREGNLIRISKCAAWAAGRTTGSKYTNGYKAAINKTKATIQAGQKVTLTLKHDETKKIVLAGSFRWYSDDKSVAKVSSKGVVTGLAKGTAVIRGRLASGRDVTCKVTVLGAFRPDPPELYCDHTTGSSVELAWTLPKHATSFIIYRSSDGGSTYKEITEISADSLTEAYGSYTDKGLDKDASYKYYIKARNRNGQYTSTSNASGIITAKTADSPYRTRVTGLPATAKTRSGKHYSVTVRVKAPFDRTATLQIKSGDKWKKAASFKLPAGSGISEVKIDFPDIWWEKYKTYWRIVIPENSNAKDYKGETMTLAAKRRYQNPAGYVQIRNTISKHGLKYYTSPVLTNNNSTRKEHVEAMIKTAYKYLGDPYVVCRSDKPGKGLDCSGLVMQACYGAGVDLWPSNPYRHRKKEYEYESRNIAAMNNLKTVKYKDRKRGDLIFFANSRGVVIHVAIYLGNDRIIHSTSVGMKVVVTGMGGGAYGTVCKVKRVFI